MRNIDAYRHALQNARRNPDGSIVESDLVELIATTIDFNEDEERRGKARRIVANRKRPGMTAADGAVVLPGMEPYAYEPDRLLSDDEGNVIPNRDARLKHKFAETRRAQDDLQKATSRASREQNESSTFALWAAEQLANGRHPAEITWDNCVHEIGLWKEGDDPDPDVDAIEVDE